MDAYRTSIVENDERNLEFVIKPAMEMIEEGRHVLILFAWIDHGERIRDLLLANGLKEEEVRLINGSTANEARKNAIKEFRKGAFKVLVGSTIFDAGVNIPIISGIVMAGAGNSEITLVQRIGRGVRNADYEDILGELPDFMLKTDGEKVAKVVDVYDHNVKFFEHQAKNRYNTAKGEFEAKRVRVVGKFERPSPTKTKKDKAQESKLKAKLEAMGDDMSAFKASKPAQSEDDLFNTNIGDVLDAFKDM